jgi:phage terminase small subunit
MAREPVLDSKGEPTGEYKFNAMGANKALELIGKHLGLFKDVQEVKNEQGFQLVILGDQPKKDDDK